MRRRPVNIRLSEAERDILKAAARRAGVGYTTLTREAALDRAADLLAREIPALRERRDRDGER